MNPKLPAVILTAFVFSCLPSAEGAEDIGLPMKASEIPSKNEQIRTFRLSNGRFVSFGPEVIVKTENAETLERIRRRFRPLRSERLSPVLYLLVFPPGSDALGLAKEIEKTEGVGFAQPNLRSQKERR